ncbi:hypothetical protein QTP86_009055 [Hemibagrus guttatus]|nr:hypothetical protein QTP86_009055 [Hemibagrus guttatus]
MAVVVNPGLDRSGVFYTDTEFKQVPLIQVMSGGQRSLLKKKLQCINITNCKNHSITNSRDNYNYKRNNERSGSAVVQTKMVFSSSSPVPSESLVLGVTQTLLSARLTNLTDSVKVLNFTYEKISDTSYVVNFTFNISNVSMTQNPELRNDTYNQVESVINNATNTLLNEAGAEPFEPQSSFFTSSGNQVNGDMTYHFQDGDTKTPAAFLNELKAQSTPITGSVVVQTRMVFDSSSPVPRESLVLGVTQTLLSARLTNLTDSVKVLKFTYEKISDTSYAVNFTFTISNVSMTQNPELRNDTYNQVESVINNATNTLLNEAGAEPFEPQSSFFTSSGNQVNGDMTYHFQDGDTKTPAAFLNELKAQSTPITGSVVVQTRMVFDSSSPVPRESLVLGVTQTLLSARLTNLTDSVKVLKFTYEKISDTSYAVNFTFTISNVSMTQNPELRNDTYNQVESVINNATNTLLNEAGAEPFEPQSSFFTSSGNQVNGDMTYHFQDGDTKTPAAFLNELKAQSTPITGSVVVQTRMVFDSSSPVPRESLVLGVTQTLLSARLTNLTDSVKVLKFTYEKISDTSYAVNFTFTISNVSMTQNPELRNDTYNQVESVINNAIPTTADREHPTRDALIQSSKHHNLALVKLAQIFRFFLLSSGNQVNGDMTYHFQDGDTKTPAAFLNELKAQSTPITGSVVVQTRMVFDSSSPVPRESLVLGVTQTLLSARLTNLTDSVKVLKFTYEKISDTSYAVNFTFTISNVSMTQNPELRNDTYNQVESVINNAILTTADREHPTRDALIQSSKHHNLALVKLAQIFRFFLLSSGNQVNGDMTYHFQDGDTKTPAAFLNELKAQSTPILGNVLIYIRLVFKNLTRIPSEADVVSAANALLDSNVRTVRGITKTKLNDPLNTILTDKNATPFAFQRANYTFNGTDIVANTEQVFVEEVGAVDYKKTKDRSVSVTSPINLFIIVIYRFPGPLGDFLEETDTLLSVFPSESTPLIILGDFNLPSDKLHSSRLLALLNSFSLSFNSCPPTHNGGNVLDLVFTHPSPATDMTATPLHISDHYLMSFTITLPILPKRNSQHLPVTRRNLHSISPSSVASCTLSSLPDHDSFSFLPLDSATDTFLYSLSSTMDLLCPLSTIHRKNSYPTPWLSDMLRNNQRELRSAERKWKKSKLDTDLIFYRMLLSKFFLDVTSSKTSFYKKKLETSAQDP